MSKKQQDPRFAKGGNTVKEKYGIQHYSDGGKKSWQVRLAKNPNIGRELSLAGVHAREVKKQKWIEEQLEVKPVKKSVLQTLLGS